MVKDKTPLYRRPKHKAAEGLRKMILDKKNKALAIRERIAKQEAMLRKQQRDLEDMIEDHDDEIHKAFDWKAWLKDDMKLYKQMKLEEDDLKKPYWDTRRRIINHLEIARKVWNKLINKRLPWYLEDWEVKSKYIQAYVDGTLKDDRGYIMKVPKK